MRTVTLFIAMSLDGYIADCQGKVDWLEGQGDDTETIDSYSEFVKEVDTVVMGWNTYNQIVTELSPDEWIYNELTTYVITHRECISSERINFVDTDPVELVKRLRVENGKDIWICGGANVIQQLVNKDMIDCYYITVIPTLLGTGIRLFEDSKKEIKLKLLKTQCYDGITELIYFRR
ncbi:MAG: dihydrofolate reductase family protein [Lachnospiraceae bacterium]|nr:dihydrofolate reductase family protein [Lachnospiraceae bacterium]